MKLYKSIHTHIAVHYKKNLTPRNTKILTMEYWVIVEQINGRIYWPLPENGTVKRLQVKQAESSDFYELFIIFLVDIRKLEGLFTEQYYLQKYLLLIFFKGNLCIISYTNTWQACKCRNAFNSLSLNILDQLIVCCSANRKFPVSLVFYVSKLFYMWEYFCVNATVYFL